MGVKNLNTGTYRIIREQAYAIGAELNYIEQQMDYVDYTKADNAVALLVSLMDRLLNED